MIISFIIGIIGFLFGIFGFSNIVLPLFYILPKASKMVKKGKLKKDVIPKCFISPIIWTSVIISLYFLAIHFRYGKEFIGGLVLGMALHILGLFRRETQKDMQEELFEFIEGFTK